VPAPAERVLAAIRRRSGGSTSAAERWHRHLRAVDGVDLFGLEPEAVRRLPDRNLTRRRIAELVKVERHEQLAINTEQVISVDAKAAALPLDRDLRARGVRLRSLGLPPSDGDRVTVEPVDGLGGGDYREADALPLKLIVFDRRVAIFPADPLNFEAGAIEVADPTVVDQLTRLFHRLWANARDPRRKGVPQLVLTTRETAIIAVLAAGHSEEFAATELGISRRTVIYALRALMDRIGVENRFQLALVLGAHRAAPLPGPLGARQAR
jgi:DNA-binding CsgD family transcriptional regulator